MSIDEIQKSVTDTTMEEVNTQKPPTITPQVTSVQPLDKVQEVTPTKVDTIGEDKLETQDTIKTLSQSGQIDLSAPPAQVQGAIQSILVEKEKPKKIKLTQNLKEQAVIQALVTLP